MKIKINVQHIAKLANLKIDKSEEKKYEQQLESIIEYVDILQSVNTDNVQETSHTTGLQNVSNEDVPSISLSQEESLSATKRKQNGFFEVKSILNDE